MVRDIRASDGHWIMLCDTPQSVANLLPYSLNPVPLLQSNVLKAQVEQAGDVTLFDAQRSIHERFAERHVRVEGDPLGGPPPGNAHRDRRLPATNGVVLSCGIDDR